MSAIDMPHKILPRAYNVVEANDTSLFCFLHALQVDTYCKHVSNILFNSVMSNRQAYVTQHHCDTCAGLKVLTGKETDPGRHTQLVPLGYSDMKLDPQI